MKIKSSDPIAQSAIWSKYKEHNTGKTSVGLSPVDFPRFVSDAFPGGILDDDITQANGILPLVRQNKRWLADKRWQSDGDKFGLIIETLDRLEAKLQFSEPEDQKQENIPTKNPCRTTHQEDQSLSNTEVCYST